MNLKDHEIAKWKPGVHKAWLLLIAGALWIGAGLMLDIFAYSWLKNDLVHGALIAAITGLVLALFIHHFGFLRVADRNLGRILPMDGKRCVFSFISWRSYCLIAVMISIGYLLRHSSLPKYYLAILYTAIGTGLILSSFRYLKYVGKLIKGMELYHTQRHK